MEIGQSIRQSKFRNEHQKAMINVLFTYGWLMERVKNHFKEYDITPQQFNILRILRGSNPNPLTVLDLKERMLDKNCDASRIIERLVTKALVKKKICTADKRRVDISITPKGLKLLESVDESNDRIDALLNGLSESEAAELNRLLDKIREE
jgi:MarR family transcriptional regulator, 2-MHQ and catechol-resistance regulon repressor